MHSRESPLYETLEFLILFVVSFSKSISLMLACLRLTFSLRRALAPAIVVVVIIIHIIAFRIEIAWNEHNRNWNFTFDSESCAYRLDRDGFWLLCYFQHSLWLSAEYVCGSCELLRQSLEIWTTFAFLKTHPFHSQDAAASLSRVDERLRGVFEWWIGHQISSSSRSRLKVSLKRHYVRELWSDASSR